MGASVFCAGMFVAPALMDEAQPRDERRLPFLAVPRRLAPCPPGRHLEARTAMHDMAPVGEKETYVDWDI